MLPRNTQHNALSVVAVDENYAAAVWRNMLLVIWRQETQAAAVVSAANSLQNLMKDYPKGVGIMQVVEERAPPPDAQARAELAKMLSTGVTSVKCSSVVHEGSGFRAAMVRGVVTAISLFTKPPYPHQVKERIAEAANWHAVLLKEPNPETYANELTAAVEQLRQKFATRVA